MEHRIIESAIESILFVSGEPVSVEDLAQNLELEPLQIRSAIDLLEKFYIDNNCGIRLMHINDKIQLCTNRQNSDYVQGFFDPPQKHSMTDSIMETLAVVAYKQPVTKAEVEAIRGVKCDYSMQALAHRRLVKGLGRKNVVGKPMLYGTTDEFLKHFGIKTLQELPQIEELEAPEGTLTV